MTKMKHSKANSLIREQGSKSQVDFKARKGVSRSMTSLSSKKKESAIDSDSDSEWEGYLAQRQR